MRLNWKVGFVPLFLLSGPAQRERIASERKSLLTRKEQSLLDALEPRAEQDGVEIVHLEVVGAKRAPVIRVYIDTPTGVSFDELSVAQAWIGDMLDEIDPFPGAYTLEVSSPGIDRPLRTLQHFRRFMGSQAKVRTAEPIDGRSNFKGEIAQVEDDAVVIAADGETFRIPIGSIKRANLVADIGF